MRQRESAAVRSTVQSSDLMTRPEVERFFGGRDRPIHHTTLYRGIKAGLYPAPIRIGPQSVRWLRSECEAALRRMIDERDGVTR